MQVAAHSIQQATGANGPYARSKSNSARVMRLEPVARSVMLIDDHAIVRIGYRALLETAGIKVITEAATGEAALAEYVAGVADVVIVDLKLPGLSGLETLAQLRARDPSCRLLACSMFDDAVFIERAILAGAMGFVSKSCASEYLVTGVKQLQAGREYLDPRSATRLAAYKVLRGAAPLANLTPREWEILTGLAQGLTLAEIAAQLALTYKTVVGYNAALRVKLGVKTDAGVIRFAVRHCAIRDSAMPVNTLLVE